MPAQSYNYNTAPSSNAGAPRCRQASVTAALTQRLLCQCSYKWKPVSYLANILERRLGFTINHSRLYTTLHWPNSCTSLSQCIFSPCWEAFLNAWKTKSALIFRKTLDGTATSSVIQAAICDECYAIQLSLCVRCQQTKQSFNSVPSMTAPTTHQGFAPHYSISEHSFGSVCSVYAHCKTINHAVWSVCKADMCSHPKLLHLK